MGRKYSLAHLTVLGCTPPEMIYIAKMSGYDYVSIRPIFMGLPGEPNYDIASNKELLRLTKIALDETGLKINDIELAKIDNTTDVSKYEPAMEISASLGVKNIISSIWTPNMDLATEKFNKLCEIATKYDIYVNLEFVTWAEIKNLQEAKKFLENINHNNTAFMIDTLHFYRSRVELSELDEIPKDKFRFAHICDGPKEIPTDRESLIFTGRDARFYVGEQAIDIKSIISKLPEDIVLSIELPHLQRVKDMGYAEHARRCLHTAKKYFGEI